MSGNTPKPSGNESAALTAGEEEFDLDLQYNHGLTFEEVKSCPHQEALLQLYGRNGPKAKRTLDMMLNCPAPL
jgi:hypothetical protein